jgi:A-kinase anchor protein 10
VINSDASPINKIDCFNEAQNFVWNRLKNTYFKEFLESPYYFLHKIEVYRIGSLQLVDILRDRQLLGLFGDAMEMEGRLNLLEFILSVDNFYHASKTAESDLIVKNAMQIYNRFFQIDAKDSLNFDPMIRNEIEEKICTKNGTPPVDMFERARQAASAILETVGC